MGKNALFDDYDAFVAKFESKKTTDDCYTPPKVYEAVLAWARNRYAIPEGAPIIRPFWPGGDYENADYPDGCYVIDNPPFSSVQKTVRFYQSRGVRFFLFANGLTLFNALKVRGVGAVVVRRMDAQGDEAIFGGGLLLSSRAAAEQAAAKVFALSPREREIQRLLDCHATRTQ